MGDFSLVDFEWFFRVHLALMTLKDHIQELVAKALPAGVTAEVAVPEHKEQGHFSTNAAFRVAKMQHVAPMYAAEQIVAKLNKEAPGGFFERIEVKAPGFINFFLPETTLFDELGKILKEKEKYGRGAKRKEKIQIEFVSANPTGPLTSGNGRGGFLGDVLARVLTVAGYQVTREYIVNDIGNQIRVLGAAVVFALELPEKKLLALVPDIAHIKKEECYKGAYVDALATKFKKLNPKKKLESTLKKNGLAGVGKWASDLLLKDIEKATKSMGIKFDVWFRESSLYRKEGGKSPADVALAYLEKHKLLKEEGGATWFLASQFGDDRDRVIRRSKKEGVESFYPVRDRARARAPEGPMGGLSLTGLNTYFFSDIAYHWNKFNTRKFDTVINIWGADHHGHVKSMYAVMKALGIPEERLKFIIVQLVRLVREGKEIRMSKRKGEFVTLQDLVGEVGIDAARFFFLMHTADNHMTFDLALAKEQSLKNPVYYAQYAAVRAKSILKKVPQGLDRTVTGGQIAAALRTQEDTELLRMLARFPEVVQEVAKDYGAHRLIRYATELSQLFNAFYEKERIIGEDAELASARLLLVRATSIVFQNLFGLLGISLPEKM